MNQLKLKALAVAIATLGAGTATAGINFANVTSRFYVSGASAARAVTPAVAAALCQANTITRYQLGGSLSNNKNHNVTLCTVKTTAQDPEVPASLSGVNVAIFGRAAGGSLFGLRPVVVPQPLAFISEATCPASDASDASIQDCTATIGTDFVVGTAQVPDLGITDEDPEFVGKVALEVDTSQADPLTAAERAALNAWIANPGASSFSTEAAYQVVWSVQAGTGFPLNDISETAMRGVVSGVYQTVGQLVAANGGSPTPAQNAQGLKVCLRTNTSGTAAGHTALWVGSNFCGTPGVIPSVNETSDDGATNGYDVVLNSSSGNLETCLTSGSPTNSIGINSLENAGIAGVKELNIDGVAPTLVNAASGKYKWYHESTINQNAQTLNATTSNATLNTQIEARSGAGAAGDTTRNAFASLYKTKVKLPANIAASGLNGILALPANGTPDAPFNPANPVAWTTKSALAGGSNCNDPFAIFP